MVLSIIEVCTRDACSSSEVGICRMAGGRFRVGIVWHLEAVDFLESRGIWARMCLGDQSRSRWLLRTFLPDILAGFGAQHNIDCRCGASPVVDTESRLD